MASPIIRLQYFVELLCGISLAYGLSFIDHKVKYFGETEVSEGYPFKILCIMPRRDFPQWTINSSEVISDDNNLGYSLSDTYLDAFRRKMPLQAQFAQLYHEGEYRCSKYSRDFHYLRVTAAGPEKDYSMSDGPARRRLHEYKLEMNKTYELHCKSAKSDDIPILWYKNGYRIYTNSHLNLQISGQMLVIHEAREEDVGEYTCTTDTLFYREHDALERFHLISSAKIVNFPLRANIIRGRSLSLNCEAQGFPPPKLTWFIGNINADLLKGRDDRITVYVKYDATSVIDLNIRDMSESDRGLYTCRAENIFHFQLAPQYDESSVFVYIRDNVIETNEDEPGLGKIWMRGEPLILQCRTPECPHCLIVWSKDGEPLQDIPNHLHIHESNNSVYIENATFNDSGIYVCAIDKNQLDVDINATITVQSCSELFEQGVMTNGLCELPISESTAIHSHASVYLSCLLIISYHIWAKLYAVEYF